MKRKARRRPDLGTRLQHGGPDRGSARSGLSGRDRVRDFQSAGCHRARIRTGAGTFQRKSSITKAYASREDFDRALDDDLKRHKFELVALAGFMRIMTQGFWSHGTGE